MSSAGAAIELSSFELAAIFLVLSAAVNWFNTRFLRWHRSVAAVVIGASGALALIGISHVAPGLVGSLASPLQRFNFSETVLDVLLAFLMFAGGMQVDVTSLRRLIFTTAVLATVGVALSIVLIGFGFAGFANLAGVPLTLGWAMVFGAIISPTDPVAVSAVLKTAAPRRSLRTLMQGESLFNDGIAIVLFGAALSFAHHQPGVGAPGILISVLWEGAGGLVLGAGAGALAVLAMHSIDDYAVETGITIALATAVYALADRANMSGPIAAASAGLIIGGPHAEDAMSERTQRYVQGFWRLVDEILNSLLFLLVGIELLVLPIDQELVVFCLVAIPLALTARFLAVLGPATVLARLRGDLDLAIVPVLTWGGVRGGLSVALALSLPDEAYKPLILTATYVVAIFSIVVQGPTLAPLIRRSGLVERRPEPSP